jgi:hypothetical protein
VLPDLRLDIPQAAKVGIAPAKDVNLRTAANASAYQMRSDETGGASNENHVVLHAKNL